MTNPHSLSHNEINMMNRKNRAKLDNTFFIYCSLYSFVQHLMNLRHRFISWYNHYVLWTHLGLAIQNSLHSFTCDFLLLVQHPS